MLEIIAKKLSRLIGQERLLLVIGGGSFGHTAVAITRKERATIGETIALTELAMMELALLVADILVAHGVSVLVYSPHSFCKPVGLKPNCNWPLTVNAIHNGVVPLVHGDIHPVENGYTIISGDELAMEAACSLGAQRVVYVGNVRGLLDRKGSVIRRITVEEIKNMLDRIGSANYVDVTGGMRRKMEAVANLWCKGLRVDLVDHDPLRLEECLFRSNCGTTITDSL